MTISFSEAIGGPVPATEIEISLRGAGGLPSGDRIRNILVLAERVSAGTSSANEVTTTPFADADAAEAWFGAGSPGAQMCHYIFDYRNSESGAAKAAVYGAAVDETGGSTAAVQTLTFATTSTSAGTWEFSVGGHRVSFAAASGDTATEQATAFCTAWDALEYKNKPPISVDNGSGTLAVVTLTASVKGAAINNCVLETITDPDIATTDTWSGSTMGAAAGTPGAGAAPTLTTVIANMASLTQVGQIVIPWTEDGNTASKSFDVASWNALIDHVNSQANATNMIPCSLVGAWKGLASEFTSVMGLDPFASNDDQRCHLLAHPYSSTTGAGTWEGELAAQFAAMRASETHLARSFDGLQFRNMDVPAIADRWTAAEKKALLEIGCSPTHCDGVTTTLVRDVMCRTSFGVVDGTVMDTLDYVRDSVASKLSTLSRMSIVADDADVPPVSHITQPGAIKAMLFDTFKDLERNGYLTDVDDNWDNVVTVLDGTTLQMSIPADVVPQLHNIMTKLVATV